MSVGALEPHSLRVNRSKGELPPTFRRFRGILEAMETTARVGRNEPCPCGSGKKYKVCCERRVDVVLESKPKSYRFVGVMVIVIGLAGAVALRVFGAGEPPANTRTANAVAPPTLPSAPSNPIPSGALAPQPPGPMPAGKVWSAEHGHYHDAPGAASANAPMPLVMGPNGNPLSNPAAMTPGPQPPGPVPEGKVWSTEHGHWHDAAPGTVPPR